MFFLWFQQLHKNQDVRLATRIHKKIGQHMLFKDPFSVKYIEIKEAISNAHKFS